MTSKHIASILILVAVAFAATSRDLRHRGHLTPIPEADTASVTTVATVSPDTIITAVGRMVTISGFEKTVSSRYESFFAANNLPDTLTAIILTIDYRDTRGNQLHRRRLRIDCDIPPGERRQMTVGTWDRQGAFYYIHSQRPRGRRQATPFSVAISVDTVQCRRQ